mmetsp:Transcript_56954/g.64545  ORF Transcript_56954/g.64545 Transcript_56954/m.64545 type:complete len:203 (-) Transcript_56954:69-677(-)
MMRAAATLFVIYRNRCFVHQSPCMAIVVDSNMILSYERERTDTYLAMLSFVAKVVPSLFLISITSDLWVYSRVIYLLYAVLCSNSQRAEIPTYIFDTITFFTSTISSATTTVSISTSSSTKETSDVVDTPNTFGWYVIQRCTIVCFGTRGCDGFLGAHHCATTFATAVQFLFDFVFLLLALLLTFLAFLFRFKLIVCNKFRY